MTAAGPTLAASVVIASRERPRMLAETVRSVLAAPRVPAELVVVDQSAVEQVELAALRDVRGCTVRYVHAPARGLARARNLGFAVASQDVVVVLDDDMFVAPDWLEQLLAARDGGSDRTIATGRILPAPPERPGLTQPPTALRTDPEPAVYRGRQTRQVIPGPNIALARGLLAELGGYDERLGAGTRFPGGEDRDLSLRLLDAGCEVRYVPGAVVLHRAWRARGDRLRLRWGYARGTGAFYAKHAAVRDRHVTRWALAELRARARAIAGSLPRAPATAAAHLVSLTGLIAGGAEWALRHRRPRPARPGRGAVVLAYHAVADLAADPALERYGVPPAGLAAQLDALTRWRRAFVDLDAILAALDGTRQLPRRAVLLTFDDAYADLLHAAFPLLAKRRIPAVAFAVADHVGGANDWDREVSARPLRLLDGDGLRAVAAGGVEVGSHTCSHPRLPDLAPAELAHELACSAARLEALGLPRPRVLAYPYGLSSPSVAAATRAAGYAAAFTARSGVVRRGGDRYELPRVQVLGSDTPRTLRLKLAVAGVPIHWQRRLLRVLRVEP